MKPVVIFGLGSYSRVAKVYLEKDSPHDVAAFTVHADYINDSELLGKPIVPFENIVETHPPDDYIMLVAMGAGKMNQSNGARLKLVKTHLFLKRMSSSLL